MDDFISREVGRTNRNLFLVNILILCGLIAVVAGTWKYCANFVLGTAPISHDDLGRLASPDQRFRTFVQVQSEKSFSTGIQEVERHTDKYTGKVTSEDVKADYLVLMINERPFVVKAPMVNDAHNFKGELVPLPGDVRIAITKSAQAADPSLHPVLMPVMLDSVDYRDNGYWGLGIGIPLLALVIWNLKKWSGRMANPRSHPLNALIRRCGDPKTVANAIDMEYRGGTTKFGRSVIVTPNWIITRNLFGTTVIGFEHVIWAYRKITKHYTYFIPTGKTHAAVVNGRFGQHLEAQMKDAKCTEFLELLQQKAPWAVLGFSAELKTMWEKNQKQMIGLVDDRRKQATMRTSAAAAPKVAEMAMAEKA